MTIRTTGAVLAALALAAATPALAADPTPQEIVQRHMDFAAKGDVDGIAGDYAEDAVAITANGTTQGRPAIRAFYANLLKPPAGGGAAPQLKATRVWQEGNVGFVTWEMGPLKGLDAFVVKGGKIQTQAVYISGAPPAPGG